VNNGTIFEAILAKSWVASSLNLVRMKITETGEEKPCDERVDFKDFKIFNELKSTATNSFNIKNLKAHQIKSLVYWQKKFKNNLSFVSIEFRKSNTLVIVNITDLINLSIKLNKNTITLKDFENKCFKVIKEKKLYNLKDFEKFLYENFKEV